MTTSRDQERTAFSARGGGRRAARGGALGPAGRAGMALLLALSLLAAAGARAWTDQRRRAMTPAWAGTTSAAGSERTLGQLNSFTLAMLLGGLRGPLVMALWSSSDQQRTLRELEDLDTKIELIRLLQPQFDTVHLYQIWNKAYNVSVEMANLASKYAAILDAVEYGRRVLAERPANIDIETQLGEVFNNKLAGSQESEYFILRILEETQADEPVVKITFPAAREQEFRRAALAAGISPRRLIIRMTSDPTELVAAARLSAASGIQDAFTGPDVVYQQLAPRRLNARAVSGPLRLEPMLDEHGNLLPELVRPRRPAPPGAAPDAWLDGSPAQFLARLQPFPGGVPAQALAYNHFMKAWVLQNHAGQRHTTYTPVFVDANPGRALRDWALFSYVEARLLEAEAFGEEPIRPRNEGERQADLERAVANVPPDSRPLSPDLLRQAVQQYERSLAAGVEAIEWLTRHVEDYPQAAGTHAASIRRLQDLQVLLAADLLYDRIILGDVQDEQAARREARQLYQHAFRRMVDFLLIYNAPPRLLPEGVTPRDLLRQPLAAKWRVIEALRAERDARPLEFEHTRTLTEFDGLFERVTTRLQSLRAAEASAGAAAGM